MRAEFKRATGRVNLKLLCIKIENPLKDCCSICVVFFLNDLLTTQNIQEIIK